METLNFSFWQEIYSIAMGCDFHVFGDCDSCLFQRAEAVGLSAIMALAVVYCRNAAGGVGFAYWQQRYRFFIGCTLVFCRKYAHLLGN